MPVQIHLDFKFLESVCPQEVEALQSSIQAQLETV